MTKFTYTTDFLTPDTADLVAGIVLKITGMTLKNEDGTLWTEANKLELEMLHLLEDVELLQVVDEEKF